MAGKNQQQGDKNKQGGPLTDAEQRTREQREREREREREQGQRDPEQQRSR